MRKIISIPYSFNGGSPHDPVIYPYRKKLYSSELESMWIDVEVNEKSKRSPEEIKNSVFDACRRISKDHPIKFVIGGDHCLTYPLLENEKVRQLIVLDEHSDSAFYDDLKFDGEVNCGNWGYLLRKARPDLKYIILGCHPNYDDALCFSKSGDSVESSKIEMMERVSGDKKFYNARFSSLKEKIDSLVGGGKAALSICADCSSVFKSSFSYNDSISFLSLDQLLNIIGILKEKTDLVYMDLMEANLFDASAAEACRKIIDNIKIENSKN